MAWVWDAPTGTYKNHALSSSIRDAAVADSLMMRFLDPEPNYGKKRGDTVTITRVMNLPLAGTVSEAQSLPSGRAAINTTSTTVQEWGYKVPLTEFEESLTHFDLRNKQQRALRDQMRLTMDKMAADALKTTNIKAVATGATLTFTTNGTPGGASAAALTVDHLREIRDYLSGTLKAPGFRNGNYVGILSTKAARGIKSDGDYATWLSPTTSEPFTTGRMRDVEGISLFETNHFDALSNSIGGGETGEAIFFGADAGYLATVLDPELRIGMSEDLGRFREVGWYGILQAGNTWGDIAASARVVHLSST